MQRFAAVVRELRAWLTSFSIVRALLPYRLYLLFGGVGILFLEELLYRTASYSSFDTLNTIFHDIPLSLLAYYGFFAGFWLTLISPELRLLSYGLGAYGFLALFPFEYLALGDFVRAAIYASAGYAVFRFDAASQGRQGLS